MVSNKGANGNIELEIKDDIASLHFLASDRRNCVSPGFAQDFMELTQMLDNHSELYYVITITHEGPVLSSGYDLNVIRDANNDEKQNLMMEQFRAARSWLSHINRPVIIGAKGPAVAAGAGLLLRSDINVVNDKFKIWWPEINVGVFPLTMGPKFIAKFGHHRAAELTFLGENAILTAREARELGLVNRIVDDVDSTVSNMAADMTKIERKNKYLLEAYEIFNLASLAYEQPDGVAKATAEWRNTYDRWYGEEAAQKCESDLDENGPSSG